MNIAKELERDMKRKLKADKKEIIGIVKILSGKEISLLKDFLSVLIDAGKQPKKKKGKKPGWIGLPASEFLAAGFLPYPQKKKEKKRNGKA